MQRRGRHSVFKDFKDLKDLKASGLCGVKVWDVRRKFGLLYWWNLTFLLTLRSGEEGM